MEVDWDELMELVDEISSENLSNASKECYNSRIRSYEKVISPKILLLKNLKLFKKTFIR